MAAAPERAIASASEPGRAWRSPSPRGPAEPETIALEDDEVVILDEAPAAARPRARGRAAAALEPAEAVAPVVAAAEPALAPPVEATEPLAAPWLATVEARRPVRHPSLLALRQDFVAELLRVATRL